MPESNNEKIKLTADLEKWIKSYLENEFDSVYNIEVEIPISNLDRLENKKISMLPNLNLMTFRPDILGILEHKKTKKIELIFIFRDTSTIGFTKIGEVLMYCRIANPKISMMISTKNLSDRTDEWINHKNNHDIISFNNKKIIIFRWNLDTSTPDTYSITPIEARESIFHLKN